MNDDELVCARCGSQEIMTDLTIVDHGDMDFEHDLAIEMQARPDAFLFKGTRKGKLKATVCGQCGKVELSIDNPQELWEIYSQRGQS